MQYDDNYFMEQAIQQAKDAYDKDEVPIGAILVMNNKIIARAHNQVEQLKDPTAHAELIAITAACNGLGSKYLPEATLYVTVEPCHMCAGAIYWSKVKRVVFGTADPKQGYHHFCGNKSPFHPKTEITSGILANESLLLMKNFFKQKR